MKRVIFLAAIGLMPCLTTVGVAQRSPPVHAAVFAPDGKALAESFEFADAPGVIKYHDLPTGEVRFLCKGHTRAVNAIAISADGTMLASGDCAGVIRLWETATGKALATFARTHEPWRPWSLAFSPNGTMLASSSPSRIVLWEVMTGKQRAVIETEGKEWNRVSQHSGCYIVFSPDGRTLAYATDNGAVQLWDVSTRKERLALRGHESAVLGIAFAPDGRTVATAGMDETVRIWDVKTGRQTATLRGHKGPVVSVAFSPDGSMVCSWCFWRQKILSGEYRDSHLCATELKVWDVPTNKVLLTLEPDEPRVNSGRPLFVVQFSENGEELLAVTADHQGADRFKVSKLAKSN